MNKEAKHTKQKEPLTLTALLRRNPIPFGDVRKYYYAACSGTVILLTLCFHISVVAVALRTDTCEQLSNVFIVFLLLFCITTIVGHQMRSFLGYGISAVSSLIVLLLLQFYHGTGVMIISDLPEYGEVFRDGAKSTDFWVLLAKVFAVVHLLLTIVFINSTLKVKEEPALKGMNVQIQMIKDWLDKNNNSLPPGRRASDYWFTAGSIFLWMVCVAYNPTMGKFDYWSMGLLVAGSVLVFLKGSFSGAFLLTASALIRCTMYQYRFGIRTPVVVAYLGVWVALLYLTLETIRLRQLSQKEKGKAWTEVLRNCFLWSAIACFVICFSIHEMTNAFSGTYMSYQKDNLPLLFFLPIIVFFVIWTRQWWGYLYGVAAIVWLWDSLKHATPLNGGKFFSFPSLEEHGEIGERATDCMMVLVDGMLIVLIILAVLCVCAACVFFYMERKDNHGTEA